jgi:hypothetical protein
MDRISSSWNALTAFLCERPWGGDPRLPTVKRPYERGQHAQAVLALAGGAAVLGRGEAGQPWKICLEY